MGRRVVMTLDSTLSSHHRGNTFFGFGACLPSSVAPERLLRAVAWPSVPPRPDGSIAVADCGSRRVEAALRRSGLGERDFIFAHADRLADAVGPETRVLLLGSHDPLGRGPLVRFFQSLFGTAPSYNARSVERILHHPAVRRHRPVVIAGGGGAWEWVADEEARRAHGVDCVVFGEADLTAPDVVRRALDGETLPAVVEGHVTPVEEIPRILGPTAGGVVEVTRGCGRGCRFCAPNLQRLRSIPVEDVLEDLRVNVRHGIDRVALHAEDIFRYGDVAGFRVDEDAVLGLFDAALALPGIRSVGASHATLGGALSHPGLLPRLSRLLGLGRPGRPAHGAFQIGIETGSRRLAKLHLGMKAAPFAADDWPEVVCQGAATLWENRFYAAYTLVVGLPGETDEDVADTIRLVRQLRRWPSLIFPLFHVPMEPRRARADGGLLSTALTAAQAELIVACLEHDAHWIDRIHGMYGTRNSRAYHVIAGMVVKRLAGLGLSRARRLALARGAEATGRAREWHPQLDPPAPRELPRLRPHVVVRMPSS